MRKSRLVLALSLAALAGAIAWVAVLAAQQARVAPGYPERQVCQFMDLGGGQYVMGYNTVNESDVPVSYTYHFYRDSALVDTETVVVPAHGNYGYKTNVEVGPGGAALRMVVSREGESAPVVDITRYVNVEAKAQ